MIYFQLKNFQKKANENYFMPLLYNFKNKKASTVDEFEQISVYF